MKFLVAGAGGFIGGHLVGELLRQGHEVRAADIKPVRDWFQSFPEAENCIADLSRLDAAMDACSGVDEVYNLAADMGGMGFIENNKALCMLSSLINTHLLLASRDHGVKRYFFSSSACVYASWHQELADSNALAEQHAYPADPEDGYGWEKLFSERMTRHFREDFGLETRIARFHNVYGPWGSFEGGREKAPAAACRKVAEVALGLSERIRIWGDGRQIRSFTYVDDCVEGSLRLMASDFSDPLNIGSADAISIQDLFNLVVEIAGVAEVDFDYDLSAPQGVRGRSSDNTLCTAVLGWQPSTSLVNGLATTYDWVYAELRRRIG